MKKEMILEKWKTKTISLLMAGIMVFAMAPLGTAVAFADEENAEAVEEPTVEAVGEPAAEAAEDVDVDAPEDVVVEEAEEAIVKAAGLTDLGNATVDLTAGSYKFKIDDPIMYVFMVLIQEEHVLNCMQDPETGEIFINLDGAGDDYDVVLYADSTTPESTPDDYYLKKTNTCTVKDKHTIRLPQEYITYLSNMTDVPEGYAGFYSSITFIFDKAAPAPVAKKANTLTLKAKKMTKIKAKKMKKKAKSFNLSKFVTISGAQGPVTYAKASGSKKITVASNGKVTLKKKIKKGTYKVKVNVTAAGNANFNAVTKAVTFKVKVK